jgi:hypothetical protein
MHKMIKRKCLGVWMDHSNAFLMELKNDTIVQNNVVSEFTYKEKEYSFNMHEKLINKKEQYRQSGYFKKLGDIIKEYNEVVLFGPTEAKDELLNLLEADQLFDSIKIDVINSDKMTENQMHAFVREYFNSSKHHG